MNILHTQVTAAETRRLEIESRLQQGLEGSVDDNNIGQTDSVDEAARTPRATGLSASPSIQELSRKRDALAGVSEGLLTDTSQSLDHRQVHTYTQSPELLNISQMRSELFGPGLSSSRSESQYDTDLDDVVVRSHTDDVAHPLQPSSRTDEARDMGPSTSFYDTEPKINSDLQARDAEWVEELLYSAPEESQTAELQRTYLTDYAESPAVTPTRYTISRSESLDASPVARDKGAPGDESQNDYARMVQDLHDALQSSAHSPDTSGFSTSIAPVSSLHRSTGTDRWLPYMNSAGHERQSKTFDDYLLPESSTNDNAFINSVRDRINTTAYSRPLDPTENSFKDSADYKDRGFIFGPKVTHSPILDKLNQIMSRHRSAPTSNGGAHTSSSPTRDSQDGGYTREHKPQPLNTADADYSMLYSEFSPNKPTVALGSGSWNSATGLNNPAGRESVQELVDRLEAIASSLERRNQAFFAQHRAQQRQRVDSQTSPVTSPTGREPASEDNPTTKGSTEEDAHSPRTAAFLTLDASFALQQSQLQQLEARLEENEQRMQQLLTSRSGTESRPTGRHSWNASAVNNTTTTVRSAQPVVFSVRDSTSQSMPQRKPFVVPSKDSAARSRAAAGPYDPNSSGFLTLGSQRSSVPKESLETLQRKLRRAQVNLQAALESELVDERTGIAVSKRGESLGLLELTVVKAANLPEMKKLTRSADAFVEVFLCDAELGEEIFVSRTVVQRRALFPVWHEFIPVAPISKLSHTVRFHLRDSCRLGDSMDAVIGDAYLPFDLLLTQTKRLLWLPVHAPEPTSSSSLRRSAKLRMPEDCAIQVEAQLLYSKVSMYQYQVDTLTRRINRRLEQEPWEGTDTVGSSRLSSPNSGSRPASRSRRQSHDRITSARQSGHSRVTVNQVVGLQERGTRR